MQKDKIYLAKKLLKMLEKNSWSQISISKILVDKKIKYVKNKKELLIIINKYFDFLLTQNLNDLEDSSSKDMLFEVMMARLDNFNSYRVSVKKLIKHFLSHPNDFFLIIPSFIESIILLSTLSKINIDGFKGLFKVKIIFILYFLILYTWNKDETESLEKTMTTLDNYLINLDKYIKFFK